ncbi:hypothetical protein PTSG_09411 [Salpingoeca rosetta]|uniref:Uncharacterized protein n=1 Tax=Salpingoeca rosetta (strain ATCC 50818 / BSB-021) TaxID=946362 RepID=F2UMJ6_SALR5|nr:uncharacterized protein PTSG_09411 [Salpingoeca rosetta]EGD78345.1 hypothetical protein PTSG_09411 [Salpingoeca rosetta]|eukprot:XP_004989668.1 hypothetical protein PTSG_09411 [Salpingoeca rosetta]
MCGTGALFVDHRVGFGMLVHVAVLPAAQHVLWHFAFASMRTATMKEALAIPLVLGGCFAAYFAVFRNRKKVDYVFEGREERQAEARVAAEQFRHRMDARLHDKSQKE